MDSVPHNLDLSAIPDLVDAARRVGVPLDGHTIGMIGEAYAAELLNLTLMKASKEGFDALTTDGRTVEVKATTGRAVTPWTATGCRTYSAQLTTGRKERSGPGQ